MMSRARSALLSYVTCSVSEKRGPLVLGGVVDHVSVADGRVRNDDERVVEREHLRVPERDVLDEPALAPVRKFDHVADLERLVGEHEQAVDDAPDDGREDDADDCGEDGDGDEHVAGPKPADLDGGHADGDEQYRGPEDGPGDARPPEVPRHATETLSGDALDAAVLTSGLFVPMWAADRFSEAVLEWTETGGVEEVPILSGVPVAHGPDDHRTFTSPPRTTARHALRTST